MRALLISIALAFVAADTPGATLLKLSLPELAQQSTAVVHARVSSPSPVRLGSDVYTMYRLQVQETWKRGTGRSIVEVAIPGGAAGGIRQVVSGAPELRPGEDYVLFLWTGRSGITQVVGLSQGVFRLSRNSQGDWLAYRPAAQEQMLDASGRLIHDEPLSMDLAKLRARVSKTLGEGN